MSASESLISLTKKLLKVYHLVVKFIYDKDCLNEKIFEALKRYEYNPDTVKLHILGGGGCLIKHFGKYDSNRVSICDDICASAKGFEYLAYCKLR